MWRRMSRRSLLRSAGGLVGAAVAGVAGKAFYDTVRQDDEDLVPLGDSAAGLPPRQHAWNASLAVDEAGNTIAPRFHRLLMLDVRSSGDDSVRRLESALRTLERTLDWGPAGLLFVLGWSAGYFERWAQMESPVPRPRPLSSFEAPELDDYDACLHLASNDEARLEEVEAALVRGGRFDGSDGPDLRAVFTLRETRTGFIGNGLPGDRMNVAGIPAAAPMGMGFKSGFKKNQASEDDVTIADGPLKGGTTMHVSQIRTRLESWYRLLDEQQRVARMFAPQLSPHQVRSLGDEAPTFAEAQDATAESYGVVGHLQTTAQARRDGRPVILRRDFDTIDGGSTGVHFVSLQRSVDDFIATTEAMNAAHLSYINPSVKGTENNGINEFLFFQRRANYAVPSRSQRSFPLLQGRGAALT